MYAWVHAHFDLNVEVQMMHRSCFRSKDAGKCFLSLTPTHFLALHFPASDTSFSIFNKPATLQPSLSLRTRYVL